MFIFFIVLLLLLCHVCYCDACKCLHGLGICVWFYPNKLMMMRRTMGSKSSPSVPVCSHSPDAVPIDSSVHKVFFERGPPCLCWPTLSPATSTKSHEQKNAFLTLSSRAKTYPSVRLSVRLSVCPVGIPFNSKTKNHSDQRWLPWQPSCV